MMIRPAAALVCVSAPCLAACAGSQGAATQNLNSTGTPSRPLSGIASPGMVGAIVLMGVQFPDPGTIGGHFAGLSFQRRTGDIVLTDGLRNSWELSSSQVAEARMRSAGYQVQNGALPTSDAVPLTSTRFGVSGRVTELSVRTTGTTGPHRAEATTVVLWEVLDLAAGSTVLGVRTTGRGEVIDTLYAAVLAAVEQSVNQLLNDSNFLRVLVTPRPRDFDELAGAAFTPRPPPGSSDSIVIAPSDLNVLPDSLLLHRLAASLVTLRRSDREETAFLLTRDGLALTTYRAVSGQRRLWARFVNGVERPARVLRSNRRAGIALIHISCADPCVSAPWTLARGGGGSAIAVVGAPFGTNPAFLVATGTSGGRSTQLTRPRFDINVNGEVVGGELVARVSDGMVFGLVLYRRRGQAAMTLAEAFRVLNIRAPEIP